MHGRTSLFALAPPKGDGSRLKVRLNKLERQRIAGVDLDQQRVCPAPSRETERPLPGDRASAGGDRLTMAALRTGSTVAKVLWRARQTAGTARRHLSRIFAARKSVVAVTGGLRNVRYSPIATKVRSAAK